MLHLNHGLGTKVTFLLRCSHFRYSYIVLGALQTLKEDEPEKYQSHFSEYIKKGVEPDGMLEMYKKVHAAIRANPTPKKDVKQPPKEHKRLGGSISLFFFPFLYTYNLLVYSIKIRGRAVFSSSNTLKHCL